MSLIYDGWKEWTNRSKMRFKMKKLSFKKFVLFLFFTTNILILIWQFSKKDHFLRYNTIIVKVLIFYEKYNIYICRFVNCDTIVENFVAPILHSTMTCFPYYSVSRLL